MKKTYTIAISYNNSQRFIVKANSLDEAENIALRKLNNQIFTRKKNRTYDDIINIGKSTKEESQ